MNHSESPALFERAYPQHCRPRYPEDASGSELSSVPDPCPWQDAAGSELAAGPHLSVPDPCPCQDTSGLELSSEPGPQPCANNEPWHYDLIEADTFEEAWRIFVEGPFDAVNVTAPFKQQAAARSDLRSPEVERIGAANILVKTPSGIKAFNSDYLALKTIIASLGPIETAVVVGFGGAGKAALAACEDSGLKTRLVRHDELAAFGALPDSPFPRDYLTAFDALPYSPSSCDCASSVVKTISPLSSAEIDCPCPAVDAGYPIPAVEADLIIYTCTRAIPGLERLRARFVLEANYRDSALDRRSIPSPGGGVARYIGGRLWLLEQARAGFPLMTGESTSMTF